MIRRAYEYLFETREGSTAMFGTGWALLLLSVAIMSLFGIWGITLTIVGGVLILAGGVGP